MNTTWECGGKEGQLCRVTSKLGVANRHELPSKTTERLWRGPSTEKTSSAQVRGPVSGADQGVDVVPIVFHPRTAMPGPHTEWILYEL